MQGQSTAAFFEELRYARSLAKEFVYHDTLYFMELLENPMTGVFCIDIELFDNRDPANPRYKRMVCFHDMDRDTCIRSFRQAPLFDGLKFDEAEAEIVVRHERENDCFGY